jgi:hypothetical protein
MVRPAFRRAWFALWDTTVRSSCSRCVERDRHGAEVVGDRRDDQQVHVNDADELGSRLGGWRVAVGSSLPAQRLVAGGVTTVR